MNDASNNILITIVGAPRWTAQDMSMNKTEWQKVESFSLTSDISNI